MNQPESRPIVPAQPDQPVYSLQALALFKTFSRDTYRAAFGLEAPPFDPSRPIKAWFDSTVDRSHPDNVTIYKVFVPGSGIRQFVMKASEAATLNLTGSVQYPKYTVDPTPATRAGAPLNKFDLSLRSEADYWNQFFKGAGVVDEASYYGPFETIYPPNEPRRLWAILFKGKPVNVGALMESMNRYGVGSPGSWDASGESPQWIPDPPAPTGVEQNYASAPMPLRDLLPNEKLQPGGMMGSDTIVVRTDLTNPAVPPTGTSGFTDEDRALLREIHRLLTR